MASRRRLQFSTVAVHARLLFTTTDEANEAAVSLRSAGASALSAALGLPVVSYTPPVVTLELIYAPSPPRPLPLLSPPMPHPSAPSLPALIGGSGALTSDTDESSMGSFLFSFAMVLVAVGLCLLLCVWRRCMRRAPQARFSNDMSIIRAAASKTGAISSSSTSALDVHWTSPGRVRLGTGTGAGAQQEGDDDDDEGDFPVAIDVANLDEEHGAFVDIWEVEVVAIGDDCSEHEVELEVEDGGDGAGRGEDGGDGAGRGEDSPAPAFAQWTTSRLRVPPKPNRMAMITAEPVADRDVIHAVNEEGYDEREAPALQPDRGACAAHRPHLPLSSSSSPPLLSHVSSPRLALSSMAAATASASTAPRAATFLRAAEPVAEHPSAGGMGEEALHDWHVVV